MGVADTILNPIFQPLLGSFGTFWSIVIIAFVVSLVVTLLYKFLTDQEKLRAIREKNKQDQQRIKELKDQPDVVLQIQKEMMGRSMETMKASLKPTLFTFIPILLIFGWLNGHLLYEPITAQDTFALQATFAPGIDGQATLSAPTSFEVVGSEQKQIDGQVALWQVKATEPGEYVLEVALGEASASKQVIVSDDHAYAPQEEKFDGPIESVSLLYDKHRPAGEFSIFGWEPGWLGWYILLSLVFSLVLRKVMRVQ